MGLSGAAHELPAGGTLAHALARKAPQPSSRLILLPRGCNLCKDRADPDPNQPGPIRRRTRLLPREGDPALTLPMPTTRRPVCVGANLALLRRTHGQGRKNGIGLAFQGGRNTHAGRGRGHGRCSGRPARRLGGRGGGILLDPAQPQGRRRSQLGVGRRGRTCAPQGRGAPG
jgi:hypothetical protein